MSADIQRGGSLRIAAAAAAAAAAMLDNLSPQTTRFNIFSRLMSGSLLCDNIPKEVTKNALLSLLVVATKI